MKIVVKSCILVIFSLAKVKIAKNFFEIIILTLPPWLSNLILIQFHFSKMSKYFYVSKKNQFIWHCVLSVTYLLNNNYFNIEKNSKITTLYNQVWSRVSLIWQN